MTERMGRRHCKLTSSRQRNINLEQATYFEHDQRQGRLFLRRPKKYYPDVMRCKDIDLNSDLLCAFQPAIKQQVDRHQRRRFKALAFRRRKGIELSRESGKEGVLGFNWSLGFRHRRQSTSQTANEKC